MSRRPADQYRRAAAMGHGQQAIWDEIRARRSFTITELWGVIDMHRSSIRQYVQRLMKGGYVRKSDDFETSHTYELVRDAGHHAPRLTREGKPVQQGGGTQNMWRSMRMLGQFTPADLAAHSTSDTTSVALATAKSYCTALAKAGYLRVVRKASPPSRQAVYKLVRDTGPLPPQVQRVKRVWDPNLQRVMTAEEGLA